MSCSLGAKSKEVCWPRAVSAVLIIREKPGSMGQRKTAQCLPEYTVILWMSSSGQPISLLTSHRAVCAAGVRSPKPSAAVVTAFQGTVDYTRSWCLFGHRVLWNPSCPTFNRSSVLLRMPRNEQILISEDALLVVNAHARERAKSGSPCTSKERWSCFPQKGTVHGALDASSPRTWVTRGCFVQCKNRESEGLCPGMHQGSGGTPIVPCGKAWEAKEENERSSPFPYTRSSMAGYWRQP